MMLVGCAGPQISNSVYEPPMPVGPVVRLPMQRHVEPLHSPKGAEQAEALAVHRKPEVRAGPTVTIPAWAFPRIASNTYGNFQIEATTNLSSGVWFAVARVYGATNVALISDTVTKRGMLFYRVKQVK